MKNSKQGRGALCPFVLLSKLSSHTELTELHRICSAQLPRKSAPSAWYNPLRMVLWVPWVPCEKFQARTRSIMFFCSFVKIIVPQKFVFFKLRESPRRLRETKKSISGSKYFAPFASLRENKNMFLCSSVQKKSVSSVSSVWKLKNVPPVKNKAPPRFNNFHYQATSFPKIEISRIHFVNIFRKFRKWSLR